MDFLTNAAHLKNLLFPEKDFYQSHIWSSELGPLDAPQRVTGKAISSSSFLPADFLPVDIIAPPPSFFLYIE